jgi:peptidoglycan hydrolase-like protein with peptidoglycan-binding domain
VRSRKEPPYFYFGGRTLRLKIPLMEGNDVKVLQCLLNQAPATMVNKALRVDGVFGQQTRQAVKQFQHYFGLRANGAVTQETYYRLGHRINSYAHNEPIFSSRLIGNGTRGPDVAVLQNRLAAFRHSRLNRPANGRFDYMTEQALRHFQSHFPELKVDGIAGPEDYDRIICWCPLGGRTLKKGRHGLDTYLLQLLLYQLHYYDRTPHGFFDHRTEKAVLQFQADAGLTTDGVVGCNTYLALGTSLPVPNHCYYYRATYQDNVTRIAQLFNKKKEDIIKINHLIGPEYGVEPGQLLLIPPPLTFHLTKKGDTLESIAHQYAIPAADIIQANSWFPSGTLAPNDMVVLPRHRQDYRGSIVYLKKMNHQSKLEQLNLAEFSSDTLIESGIKSPAQFFMSPDQSKAAILEHKPAELKVYDFVSNITRSYRLCAPAKHLSWSPDSRRLIIDGNLVISAAGAQPQFSLEEAEGQWLADSQTLIYIQGKYSLRKVHSATGRDQEVLSLPGEDIIAFYVNAAHHQLVFFTQPPQYRNTLTYFYNLITGELKEFSHNDYAAVWSDNGMLLLLARDYYGEFYPWFCQELCLYEPAASLQKLESVRAKSIKTFPGGVSPDHQFYLFCLSVPSTFFSIPEQAGDLFVKRIGSQTVTQITLNQAISDPVWIDR